MGLTATLVDEIDRNTYRIFELEDNNSIFAYELDQAIEEGHLVNYELPIVSETKLMKDGIRYRKLSEEEKEQFDALYPEYKGSFAQAIYHNINYVSNLIANFKDTWSCGII